MFVWNFRSPRVHHGKCWEPVIVAFVEDMRELVEHVLFMFRSHVDMYRNCVCPYTHGMFHCCKLCFPVWLISESSCSRQMNDKSSSSRINCLRNTSVD